ncbi:hypothetical protein [uncultured Ilumatobacter sp.]|uniref:hypothetical protein n=1 Tax=uncultured Ilumatobacter sp. TaxID=879968 RepID=UPI00374FC58D
MSEAPAPCDRIGIGVSSGGSLGERHIRIPGTVTSEDQGLLDLNLRYIGSA